MSNILNWYTFLALVAGVLLSGTIMSLVGSLKSRTVG